MNSKWRHTEMVLILVDMDGADQNLYIDIKYSIIDPSL